jgi:hypothetical protein
MLKGLYTFLEASGVPLVVTTTGDRIDVAISPGVLAIYYEPRGQEFYGEWLGPLGRRIELVELARRCGIQTQFMSHDRQSAHAVFEQVSAVLRCLTGHSQLLEET